MEVLKIFTQNLKRSLEMNSKGFYALRSIPSQERVEAYLETARQYLADDPPVSAYISYTPPHDIPLHERDQHLAYKRDNPEVCYVVFF